MTMKTFKPTHEMIQAGNAVFMSMAYTETLRPHFEKIQKELLQFWKPEIAPRWIEKGRKPEIITNWERLYLASDSDTDIIYKEYEEMATKAGFKPSKPGNCALLEAESVERIAKRLLIDVMKPITGFDTDDVLCSANGLENYKKAVNLTLRLLAPYCNPSLKVA